MTSVFAQIQDELARLVASSSHQTVLHKPYITTKHGQLRSHAGSAHDVMSGVNDLATLESLTEVWSQSLPKCICWDCCFLYSTRWNQWSMSHVRVRTYASMSITSTYANSMTLSLAMSSGRYRRAARGAIRQQSHLHLHRWHPARRQPLHSAHHLHTAGACRVMSSSVLLCTAGEGGIVFK